MRAQMLRYAAKTLGFRGGMSARTKELLKAMELRSEALTTMFQFAPLMSKPGIVPPVIVAAKDVATFAPDQVRTANQVYKIERDERFVSTPPTWRDYLFVGLPTKGDVDLPDLQARPQDDKELAIWKAAVVEGWAEGREQADSILTANFNRLVRDYTGMMTYSVLLQNRIITATRIAESQQTVTGDQRQIVLGDTHRRVTAKAGFQTDPQKWQPTVRSTPAPTPATSLAAPR
ncbi:MAG TPA: type IV secretory system conjugative DNA transfer family protein [Burkholderiaceae bacterium]|nr:type IV secretory system conjugative DNA transfer family protein [Burkholderiaceae bacterium]